MKRIEITINGTAYPCSPTMGAMLRFKQETGREITEIDPTSFTDLCTYLWCCVASAAKREGKPFDMSLMEFADSLTPEDMTEWNAAITADAETCNAAPGEKKRKRR
nr:MAG TPA: tail assembly chaperone protein [Caudoviricetes sp.]